MGNYTKTLNIVAAVVTVLAAFYFFFWIRATCETKPLLGGYGCEPTYPVLYPLLAVALFYVIYIVLLLYYWANKK